MPKITVYERARLSGFKVTREGHDGVRGDVIALEEALHVIKRGRGEIRV